MTNFIHPKNVQLLEKLIEKEEVDLEEIQETFDAPHHDARLLGAKT